MPITATIDRFEGENGEIAVLEVEPERTVVNVSRSDLPNDAEQGDVVRLEGKLDREETNRRRAEVREQIERLKQRSSERE